MDNPLYDERYFMFRSLFLSCFLSTALFAQTPHLFIEQPDGDLIDRRIEMRVEGLAPFQEIELKASTQDQKGELWSSHAYFQADERGIVSVAKRVPLEDSSYDFVDGMGLFWSMVPNFGDLTSSFKCKDDIFPVSMELFINGHLIEQSQITRYLKAPDVQRIDVQEEGLVGALFVPSSDAPLPVVITLSGSNGGLGENRAKLLASNGFIVFALGYFGIEGLPSGLQEIPLEYFETAFAWLQKQPNIDTSRVGLYGVSRGAELALILGSLFPDSIQAIVAVAPSSVVHGGLSETPVHAWLYEGNPIAPFAVQPELDLTGGKGQTPDNPVNTRENFLEG